jgi:hypothetical protein
MKNQTQEPFKKKPGKAAEATNRTAQVALMKKQTKTSRKSQEKVAEADPGCAVRTTELDEKGRWFQSFRHFAFLKNR